jgi:cation diffusion facilitator CzcD-associated flavoprotein CzcO
MAIVPNKPTVAIVGAGTGGIAMGIQLAHGGYDFTLFDRGDGFGGGAMTGKVWLANCSNYFRHSNGKVVTQFPYHGHTFVERLSRVGLEEFHQSANESADGRLSHSRCRGRGDGSRRDHRT